MMPGISFNLDGPIMTGTWYNPKTGDKFTVRDTYFEDNNYMVITTDGRRMDYNMIQNYVKSDSPIPKMEQPKAAPQPVKIGDIQETSSSIIPQDLSGDEFILEDDMLLLQTKTAPQKEFVSSVPMTPNPLMIPAVSENYKIIEKAFSKVKAPKFDIVVKWTDFPKQEIEMLSSIMDVPMDEIKAFIFEKYINDTYKEKMKDKLNILTNENMGIEEKPAPKATKTKTAKKK